VSAAHCSAIIRSDSSVYLAAAVDGLLPSGRSYLSAVSAAIAGASSEKCHRRTCSGNDMPHDPGGQSDRCITSASTRPRAG
jgi:hypothetical protein